MTLTGVLFVGGESRRMGADKATLVLHGEPLWSRQLGVLRELKPEKILISARTKPGWCPPEIEVLLDEPPSRGPLSGLSAALNRMRTTHLLALAIDLPRMNSLHLQKLWKLVRPNCGVLPVSGNDSEPLCSIYPGGALAIATAEKALSSRDVSLRSFANQLLDRAQMQAFPIAESDRGLYLNVNSPEEFSKADPCKSDTFLPTSHQNKFP